MENNHDFIALMVERGKNVLFYSALLYIDRKKIFRQPEPKFLFLTLS